MLIITGGEALAAEGLERLRGALLAQGVECSALSARQVYFAELSCELDAGAELRLRRLLRCPAAGEEVPAAAGELLLTVPRPGTISPWSSKATDIVRGCGLRQVARLERGTAWHLAAANQAPLGPAQRQAALPLLHDRMLQCVLDSTEAAAAALFAHHDPRPCRVIELTHGGRGALERADAELGLALSAAEMDYVLRMFAELGRDPTDVELYMFAQLNSEHCRHKIFNARFDLDGRPCERTLMEMIRNTCAVTRAHLLSAYADNAAVMEGTAGGRLQAPAPGRVWHYRHEEQPILMKVETHNHPTAISPFPGAATGSGGEIRDEGATGRGARPKGALCGFSVSDLRIPGFTQPWEGPELRCARQAAPLQIMLEGPLGSAAFNNEFGRPCLGGYFRTFLQAEAGAAPGQLRGYHKPVMLAGGWGTIGSGHIEKVPLTAGDLIIVLGGPAMNIGLGGGAASSVHAGGSDEELDFASVQRPNPEMQRRCQEVIDQCTQLGADNPILFIHDVGAGGLSNAVPELLAGGGVGGRIDLRRVPSAEPGLSPLELWCNEAQERYVLAVHPGELARFEALCRRERAPFAVIGQADDSGCLVVADPHFGSEPVHLPLGALLEHPPREHRRAVSRPPQLRPLDTAGIELREACARVLRLPGVAEKTFLITIADRSVSGLVARDQMVGPWQVPVADVAVTACAHDGYGGEAAAIGERAPVALIDVRAAVRLAVAEAITNLSAAYIGELERVKLSANWMAACGHAGEDAALYEAVRTLGLELAPALGLSVPVGKDSLSMRTLWHQDGRECSVTAPQTLVVSAFARCEDIRRTLTPQLRTDCGPTRLVYVDLSEGRHQLGGSALAQVYGQLGERSADLRHPVRLKGFFDAVQFLHRQGLMLAYHDISDGGLFVTLCEMAFAGHTGLDVSLDALDPDNLRALFGEEIGAVLQVRGDELEKVLNILSSHGLASCLFVVGAPGGDDRIIFRRNGVPVIDEERRTLRCLWAETTFRLQALRDDEACAREEFEDKDERDDPGLPWQPSFDPNEDVAAPFIASGRAPRLAVLREQGSNSQREMAAAFDRASFECVDVHMSDLAAGEVSLRDFRGLAACGGFSYGDVLGAGAGWAGSILHSPRLRDEFAAFFARPETFALGVCNGCQMLSLLRELIPGTRHWPHFAPNRSGRFEARFIAVAVEASPSIFLAGMQGSLLPVMVSHAEGRAEFDTPQELEACERASQVALRYVDHRGAVTQRYPLNPNGSVRGIAGVTSDDGRFTILMPHPERVMRTVANSWHPPGLGEDGPWVRMFRNARRFAG